MHIAIAHAKLDETIVVAVANVVGVVVVIVVSPPSCRTISQLSNGVGSCGG